MLVCPGCRGWPSILLMWCDYLECKIYLTIYKHYSWQCLHSSSSKDGQIAGEPQEPRLLSPQKGQITQEPEPPLVNGSHGHKKARRLHLQCTAVCRVKGRLQIQLTPLHFFHRCAQYTHGALLNGFPASIKRGGMLSSCSNSAVELQPVVQRQIRSKCGRKSQRKKQ